MDSFFSIVFQAMGLTIAAKSDKNNLKNDRKLKILNGCCITFALCLLIMQYVLRKYLYYSKDLIGQATDWVQMILPIMSHLVVVCEAKWKKNVQEDLNARMYVIQKKLDYDQKTLKKILIKYFLILNGVCLSSEILIITMASHNKEWIINISYKTFSLIVTRLSDFQFLYYILQLTYFLKNINKNLSRNNHFDISKNYCRRLKKSGKIVNEIWMASDLLNLRFGLSLLLTCSSNLLLFIASSYWVLYQLICGGYGILNYAIASISLNISPIVNFSVLFYCCSNCIYQVTIIFI